MKATLYECPKCEALFSFPIICCLTCRSRIKANRERVEL